MLVTFLESLAQAGHNPEVSKLRSYYYYTRVKGPGARGLDGKTTVPHFAMSHILPFTLVSHPGTLSTQVQYDYVL